MEFLLVVVVWFALGYLAGRATVVDFESRFGSGTGAGAAILCFATGPFGLISTLLGSAMDSNFKETWAATLGLAPVVQRPSTSDHYYIDRRRGKFSEFLTVGVKNLPDYDANTEAYVRHYPILEGHIRSSRS